MGKNLMVSSAHPLGERSAALPACVEESLSVDSFAGRIEVRWAPDEAVTAQGQLSFFVDFLKQANLFEPFVARAPLTYASPNAPRARDVLGTLVLALLGIPDGETGERLTWIRWQDHVFKDHPQLEPVESEGDYRNPAAFIGGRNVAHTTE